MNNKTFLTYLFFITIMVWSCNDQPKETEATTGDKEVTATPDNNEAKAPVAAKPKSNRSSTDNSETPAPVVSENASTPAELLQGKWQSTDDKTNYLVFEGNHRREIAEGTQDWSDEAFTLSDRCSNDMNKDGEYEPGKGTYITCKESNLCWSIDQVDNKTLTLMYMGRGNILKYKRVK